MKIKEFVGKAVVGYIQIPSVCRHNTLRLVLFNVQGGNVIACAYNPKFFSIIPEKVYKVEAICNGSRYLAKIIKEV